MKKNVAEARVSQSFDGTLGKFIKTFLRSLNVKNAPQKSSSSLPTTWGSSSWSTVILLGANIEASVVMGYFSINMFLTTVSRHTGLDRTPGLPCADTHYILMLYSLLTSKTLWILSFTGKDTFSKAVIWDCVHLSLKSIDNYWEKKNHPVINWYHLKTLRCYFSPLFQPRFKEILDSF